MSVCKNAKERLQLLRNLPLGDLSLCGTVVLLAFGNPWQRTSRTGKPVVGYEYNLHVTCGWRFIHHGSILLGSGDILLSRDSLWVRRRESILSGQLGEMVVKEVEIGPFQSISILFVNGLRFQAVPLESSADLETELWRFFKTGVDCHLISKAAEILMEGDECDQS